MGKQYPAPINKHVTFLWVSVKSNQQALDKGNDNQQTTKQFSFTNCNLTAIWGGDRLCQPIRFKVIRLDLRIV